jgi:hypothetical protein
VRGGLLGSEPDKRRKVWREGWRGDGEARTKGGCFAFPDLRKSERVRVTDHPVAVFIFLDNSVPVVGHAEFWAFSCMLGRAENDTTFLAKVQLSSRVISAQENVTCNDDEFIIRDFELLT